MPAEFRLGWPFVDEVCTLSASSPWTFASTDPARPHRAPRGVEIRLPRPFSFGHTHSSPNGIRKGMNDSEHRAFGCAGVQLLYLGAGHQHY